MRIKVERYCHVVITALLAIMVGLAVCGCGQGHLTGVVQRSTAVAAGWELALGVAETADYILVEGAVLMDREGRILISKDPRNRLLLGSRFVGMRIKVAGDIERDEAGRRFIRVTQREQIEIQ